jgi:IS5 family transposase
MSTRCRGLTTSGRRIFRPALEQIIDMCHLLVRLAGEIDRGFLKRRFTSVCTTGPGQSPLPKRLIAGLRTPT